MFSLGGDGTFLAALRRFRQLDPVFCGINAGHLGFLQEIDEDTLIPALDRILKGEYVIEEHHLLDVVLLQGQRETSALQAFNDVVIERRDTRTLRLTLKVDGTELGPVVADGLLVATTAGSTAYAFAAGGAVVHPACPVLQVLAINAHRSRLTRAIDAPLIVPHDAVIDVAVDWTRERQARLVLDGEEAAVTPGDQVRIRRSRQRVRVLRLGLVNFWERLRSKFL